MRFCEWILAFVVDGGFSVWVYWDLVGECEVFLGFFLEKRNGGWGIDMCVGCFWILVESPLLKE